MTNFVKIANKIIAERGGDKYKEEWLRTWLANPDNEDKMMQAIMMKELSAEMSRKNKGNTFETPEEIKI